MQTKISFIRKIFYPFLPVYWLGVSFRNIFFDLKLLKVHQLNCSVISIGNLTTGGTGKTPLTIFLAKELLKKNIKVGIITRGYGRSSKETFIICNNKKEKTEHLDPSALGDEPILFYRKLINVPIAISKNRINAGKLILQEYELDVILLDDGFQHRHIKRDIDILLINSLDQKINYKLLPVGNLREPWKAIKRSDFIIQTKRNLLLKRNEYIENKLKGESNVFIADSFNRIIDKVNNQEIVAEEIKNKKAVLLSGIGDPKSFDISSRQLRINIIGHVVLRDHFQYTKENIRNILNDNKIKKADFILTTEKDLVKIEKLDIGLKIIPLELIFKIRGMSETENFINSILEKLNLRHPIRKNDTNKSKHKRPSCVD